MRLDDDDDQDEVSICEAFVKKSIEKHSFFFINLMNEISDAPFVRDA